MSSYKLPQTILVSDNLCRKVGVTFNWAQCNEVAIYANALNDKDEFITQANEGKIHFYRQDNILDDRELRKLINESNTTFILSRNMPPTVQSRIRILELSREHRSSIKFSIESMERTMRIKKSDKYRGWIKMLINIDQIWHLCELLHLHLVPADTVLPKLLEWTRMDRAELDDLASEVMSTSHTKGANLRHSGYWDVIMGLLLIGRFDSTRALLKLHSEADSIPFFEADILLRSIPVYTVCCGLSASEFNARWRAWKSSVRSKINSGVFATYPKLLKLMTVIGANEPSFDLFKPYCANWYQMMVSVLLFSDPIVKIHDLNYHANQCIEYFGGRSKLKLFDHTILALLDSNLNLAINYLQYTADGGWCAVHLTNLLHLAGSFNTASGGDIEFEQMLLDYGELLMSHESYWQVGLSYLEQCKVHGLEVMKIMLLKLPLNSEDTALKLITNARKYKFNDVVNDICKVLTTCKLKNNDLSGALTWALMSNDAQYTDYIADTYLRHYALGRSDTDLNCSQVLMNLGQSVLISSKLTFLAKYCEFHSLFDSKKGKESTNLLIQLIESKVAPKYFWFTLLLDALPFLQSESPLFSHDDTTIILACLEELSTDIADNVIRGSNKFKENIPMLRKTIAKTLGTTLLFESNSCSNEKIIKCL